MKKSLLIPLTIVVITIAAVLVRGQVLNTVATNFVSQWVLESTPSGTTLGTVVFNPPDALIIGIQLGNMTNAAGEKLFNATYLTNRLTTATFVANCANSVTPWWISLTVQ